MFSIKNLDRLCLIVIIVVTVLSAFWVVKSGMTQRLTAQKKNDLLSKRMDDLVLADASLQRINEIVAEEKDQLKFLNALIPESAEIGKLLKRLNGLIKARHISLISIQPLATVKEALYSRIPIQMTLTGAFADAYRLLCDFEGMDRLVRVERIAIVKVGEGESCKVDLTISIFERQGSAG